MIFNGEKTRADVAPHTRVNQRDPPIGWPFAQNLDLAAVLGHHTIAVARCPVVQKVVLDHARLVAKTKHEIPVPMLAVVLHDVPQNRLRPDRDHRLGYTFRILTDTRPETAAKKHYLHLANTRIGLRLSLRRNDPTVGQAPGTLD